MNKLQALQNLRNKRTFKLRSLIQLRSKQLIDKRKPQAQKDYEKKVSDEYIKHNQKANERAYKKVLREMPKSAYTKYVWKNEYEKEYIKTPISKELKDTLAEQTEAYYIARKKKNLKKAEYELNMTDKDTIKVLSKSDLLWIKNHAKRTNVSTEMGRIITKGIEDNLSGDEIAEKLSLHFEGLAPEKYVAIFGEKAYWESVTNTNLTRITSFNDLNHMQDAEITQYRILTRGALACPICAPYAGKVYDVAPAVAKKDTYLEYAEKGDIESMKAIYTFGEANVDGLGETPPFHPNCYCILDPIQEEI